MPQEVSAANPITVGPNGAQVILSGAPGTLTIQETAGVAASVSWQDQSRSIIVQPIPALGWVQVDLSTLLLNFTGNGAVLNVDFGSGYRLHQPQAFLQVGSSAPATVTGFVSSNLNTQLYTCPAGYKAQVFTVSFAATNGDSVNLRIQRISGAIDYITPKAGSTVGSSATFVAGQAPGDDINIGDSVVLQPGDVLLAADLTNVAHVDADFLLVPL